MAKKRKEKKGEEEKDSQKIRNDKKKIEGNNIILRNVRTQK